MAAISAELRLRSCLGIIGTCLQNCPRILAHIQYPDDLNIRGQHLVTNERFVDHDTAQLWKGRRFDRVPTSGIFPDGDPGLSDLPGNGHFNSRTELPSEVTTDVSP